MDSEIPSVVRKIFGRPPIVAGESSAHYEELMALVRAEIDPQSLQEWLLTKDVVDAEWELLRLRGLKVGMLHACIPRTVISQIDGGLPPLDPLIPAIRKHLIGSVSGDEQATKELEKLLEEHNLTLEIITAAAFESTTVAQLRTDRMATSAYERRNAAYAELEWLRSKKRKPAPVQPDLMGEDDVAVDAEAPPTAPADGADVCGPNPVSNEMTPDGRS